MAGTKRKLWRGASSHRAKEPGEQAALSSTGRFPHWALGPRALARSEPIIMPVLQMRPRSLARSNDLPKIIRRKPKGSPHLAALAASTRVPRADPGGGQLVPLPGTESPAAQGPPQARQAQPAGGTNNGHGPDNKQPVTGRRAGGSLWSVFSEPISRGLWPARRVGTGSSSLGG